MLPELGARLFEQAVRSEYFGPIHSAFTSSESREINIFTRFQKNA
jgi:hypothetical protein